jgi:hypothetical protein
MSLGIATFLAISACASSATLETATPTEAPLEALPVAPEEFVDTASGAFVHIDLDDNILRFMHGDVVLWQAPVGTGTGLRLRGEDGDWEFSTPRGVYEVKFKEELPVWYLPDWFYVEKNLPVPPASDPSRRLPGQLGVAAVYLGEEIAIHGTERPELLGQRVSHGCIRLGNKFAQRLYHNVQIGTPIVIVGGERWDNVPPGPTTNPGAPRPRPADTLAGVPSPDLVARLRAELEANDRDGDWVPLASRLITRGLREDSTAMRGLLRLAGTATRDPLAFEFATFLADAYARGSWIAVVSLARIEEPARERATAAIVEATMALYAGSLQDEGAPWPTRRVHDSALGPEGRSGWDALASAEQSYRRRFTRGPTDTNVR